MLDAYWQALRTDRRLATHAAVYAWAAELFKPGWALDAGCEVGFGSALLAQANPRLRVVGCDLSFEALAFARDLLAGSGVRLFEAAANALPLPAGSLSGVCLINLLHLVPDPEAVLQEAYRALRTGGRLVVSLPLGDDLPPAWRAGTVARLTDSLAGAGFAGIAFPESISSRLPILPATRWKVGAGTPLLVGVCTRATAGL